MTLDRPNLNYTGTVNINAGTLSFGDGVLDNAASFAFGGGTLQWTGYNTENLSGRIASIPSGVAAIFYVEGGRTVVVGGLTGPGGLTETGDGTRLFPA